MTKRTICAAAALALLAQAACAQSMPGRDAAAPADPADFLRQGKDETAAAHVAGPIHYAKGFGNTILIETGDGNIVIDTSLPSNAAHHKKLLAAVNDKPVSHVIVTHGHGDHTGGLSLWLKDGATFVAHENFPEFLHYQERLKGFFGRRNAAQFGFPFPVGEGSPGNYAATIPEGFFVKDRYAFTAGGLDVEIIHTPSETYDALTVWVPSLRAAFTGDLVYESFPNLYTLRGTRPRWALDYVASLDKVLALKPALLVPSHGEPIEGERAVREALTRYRDAILHVHDATVAGMNEGKSVETLMREISLPEALDIGEGYGRIDWSVHGIYEGYAGWFDGEPASLYPEDGAAAAALVEMAGGPGGVIARAEETLAAGDALLALRLVDMALGAAPENRAALEVRLAALEALLAASRNLNEAGWLGFAIRETKKALSDLD